MGMGGDWTAPPNPCILLYDSRSPFCGSWNSCGHPAELMEGDGSFLDDPVPVAGPCELPRSDPDPGDRWELLMVAVMFMGVGVVVVAVAGRGVSVDGPLAAKAFAGLLGVVDCADGLLGASTFLRLRRDA